jgi:hypothetical protein
VRWGCAWKRRAARLQQVWCSPTRSPDSTWRTSPSWSTSAPSWGRYWSTKHCAPSEVSSYGKAAVVGSNGELEHAAALIHPKFGAPVRARLGRGPAIIPSTKLLGGIGTRIVFPLTNCSDIWAFDDMDAMSFGVDDSPRPDEILAVLGLGIGGRPLHRIGAPA